MATECACGLRSPSGGTTNKGETFSRDNMLCTYVRQVVDRSWELQDRKSESDRLQLSELCSWPTCTAVVHYIRLNAACVRDANDNVFGSNYERTIKMINVVISIVAK